MRYFLRTIILTLAFVLLPFQAMGQHTIGSHQMTTFPAMMASSAENPTGTTKGCCDTAVPSQQTPSSCLPFGLPSDFSFDCPSQEDVMTYANRIYQYTPVLLDLETPPPML